MPSLTEIRRDLRAQGRSVGAIPVNQQRKKALPPSIAAATYAPTGNDASGAAGTNSEDSPAETENNQTALETTTKKKLSAQEINALRKVRTATMRTAALRYTELGLCVMPLRGKAAFIENWPRQASSDPKQIESWWSQEPYNIGVACGARSGVVVIDVDAKADPKTGITGYESLAKLEAELGALVKTVISLTGSGGMHIFQKYPEGVHIHNNASKIGLNIDVRGQDGQVVVPPSIHPVTRKPYCWAEGADIFGNELPELPQAWLDKLASNSANDKKQASEARNLNVDDDDDKWQAMLDNCTCIEDFLGHGLKRGGTRNDATMAISMCAKAKGISKSYTTDKLCRWIADIVVPSGMTNATQAEAKSSTISCISTIYGRADYKFSCGLIRGLHSDGKTGSENDVLCAGENCAFHDLHGIFDQEGELKMLACTAADGPGDGRKRPAKPEFRYISAAELGRKVLAPQTWIVPEILTTGLSFLCGKPKVGKSWLALALALAVAEGKKALGNIPVEKRTVLYLGLEDTERRLQARLKMLSRSEGLDWPDNLLMSYSVPRANEGGLDILREMVMELKVELVVIDTFQHFRRASNSKENSYAADYAAASEIKKLADELGISILIIHHLKKASDNDFVQSISGTSGITGAADTLLVLDKARMVGEAVLKITGRDVDEKELALLRDEKSPGWLLLKDAQGHLKSQERRDIVEALKQSTGSLTPTEIAARLGKKRTTVNMMLTKMLADGEVNMVSKGKYTAASKSTH